MRPLRPIQGTRAAARGMCPPSPASGRVFARRFTEKYPRPAERAFSERYVHRQPEHEDGQRKEESDDMESQQRGVETVRSSSHSLVTNRLDPSQEHRDQVWTDSGHPASLPSERALKAIRQIEYAAVLAPERLVRPVVALAPQVPRSNSR